MEIGNQVEASLQRPEIALSSYGRKHQGAEIKVGLLTGCQDKHYALALAMGLASDGVSVDVVGSDEVDSPELHTTANLRFLNLRGSRGNKYSFAHRVIRVLIYYAKLIRYISGASPKILHILWNNELEIVDRTFLMLWYKVFGKKTALTAHNVNRARRDCKDSWINRATLRLQYRLCDQIFVHTAKMKSELCQEFGVGETVVTVIPYPLNCAVPNTELTPCEAKRRLGLRSEERAILFFGKIRPYKGVELLLDAFRLIAPDEQANYRLILAGEPKKGSEDYLRRIQESVNRDFFGNQVLLKAQFIPDEDMELYFKAADVLVLPYKEIFQSGILFVAYRFGLPTIATDVGSFREDIIEGRTGFICRAADPGDLAQAVETYFASDLYRNLNVRRYELIDYANATHSWSAVAKVTRSAYARMLERRL
jgi:D-inositol-3-phosphate glycosyltransferase